jgi:Zn-dependent protease with chaperone function
MDGSRRSAHANAYFTGFGAAKRVVFYDTLLRQLTPGEVEAVLAHELGHFQHRHILKRMVASLFAMSLAGFALLGWLSTQALVLHRAGRAAPAFPAGIRRAGQRPMTRWPCCCSCW